jgi:hypothetical protein
LTPHLPLVEHYELVGGDIVDAGNLRDQILSAHEPVAEALGHKLAEVVPPRTELLTDRNYRHRRSPEQARDYRCVKSGPRRNHKCSPVTWQTAARWLCAAGADRIFAPARAARIARGKKFAR